MIGDAAIPVVFDDVAVTDVTDKMVGAAAVPAEVVSTVTNHTVAAAAAVAITAAAHREYDIFLFMVIPATILPNQRLKASLFTSTSL